MKKFDIITEADAPVLERGTTVELASGGHITPLARDTLRERRIAVVEEDRVSADEAKAIVAAWLATPLRDPNAIRQLAKIKDLERSAAQGPARSVAGGGTPE